MQGSLACMKQRTESLPCSLPSMQQRWWQPPGRQLRIQAPPCLRDGHLRMENWVPTPFCGPAHVLKVGNSLPRPTHRPRHVLNTLRCRPKSTSEKCSSLWQGKGGEALPWATPSAKLRIKSVFRAWSFPAAWKQEEPNPREQ